MDDLISVIVPVYNMERYLDKCVESIMAQTYTNLEIILVDDGSTDGSCYKCDAYSNTDCRIKVIHKTNGGLSSARNAGLDICKGDYVGFVDSDDFISPTMYEELLRECSNNKTIATCSINHVTEDGIVTGTFQHSDEVVSAKQLLRNILCHDDDGSVCSRLFSRDIIGSIRFDENKLNEDVLFMVSIINNVERVVYLSCIGYYYLQRTGSISRTFGKAVHDMVGNSVKIRQFTNMFFPDLFKEAERFEIFQHMSFLLCCPSDIDRNKDVLYNDVLLYVRKHLLAGAINSCFTFKEKIKLLGVSICPCLMSKLIEKKIKKANSKYERESI